MFSVGIIGLPNVGKSTLFKVLTKITVPIANYPFTTIEPHHGIVEVKDKRLEKIAKIINPQRITPPLIEFIDIAGLVKGAHRGEGLGNQFLSIIGKADILLEIVRNFSTSQKDVFKKEKEEAQYQLWEKPNPERDIKIIKEEILKKDQKIVSNFLEKKGDSINKKDEEKIARMIIEFIEKGEWLLNSVGNLPDKKRLSIENLAKKMGLISIKPIIYLFNSSKAEGFFEKKFQPMISLNLRLEEEISDLTNEEREEIGIKSHLDDIIATCYNKLDLITFYTIKGNKEARATELKKGTKVIEAAEEIHTDFKEKFISAELLKFDDLVKCKSWQKAKEKGLLKTKGKDYIVEDGDIIEFKI